MNLHVTRILPLVDSRIYLFIVNIYSCSTPVIYYFNKCLNIKKVKLQNIYSIKARISFLDIRNPLFSLFLLIGSIIDMMRLAKIQVSKNNEI